MLHITNYAYRRIRDVDDNKVQRFGPHVLVKQITPGALVHHRALGTSSLAPSTPLEEAKLLKRAGNRMKEAVAPKRAD